MYIFSPGPYQYPGCYTGQEWLFVVLDEETEAKGA